MSAPTEALWVAHEKFGAMRVATFQIVPTAIENQNYASVRLVDPKSHEKNEMGYFLVKYSFDTDRTLTVWDIDLSAAVLNGKLNAFAGKVTDSTAKLREFVKTADPNELFPPKEFVSVFEKIESQ